jgi:predicted HTH domain antitoxin
MPSFSYEAKIHLAIEAIQKNENLSIRAAAKIYNVQRSTLQNRLAGQPARRDIPANSRKLTDLEEGAIVQYVIELATRSFPPRLCGVEDMANQLLCARDAPPVGKRWAHNFVRRQPELRTRFARKYDYQRALCEDPRLIREWFDLVRNTIAKYGIVLEDIYNFDETGFMMGIIFAGMVVTTSDGRTRAKLAQPGNREWATVIQAVNALGWAIPPFIILAAQYHLANWYQECNLPAEWRIATTDNGWTTNDVGLDWIKHFDHHTARRTKGTYRLLILDGHESHHLTKFELYCKSHNIITLCMPPHSSHLLQPLDVGCFAPLKVAYGR